MKKSIFVGLVSALAVVASIAPAAAQDAAPPATTEVASTPSTGGAAQVVATRGQDVYTASGRRVGRVVRVNDDGSVRVSVALIQSGSARLPADTLSLDGDRLVTSLTTNQVVALAR